MCIILKSVKMLSVKSLVTCGLLLCFVCNIILLTFTALHIAPNKCYLTINNVQSIVNVIPDDFVSIGIDTSEFEIPSKIHLFNGQLMKMASALAPARLRIGGTMSERLIFSKDDLPFITCKNCQHKQTKSVCVYIKKMCKKFLPFFLLTGSKWLEINEFCKNTGLKLLFSLNVLLRSDNGWMDQNAKELISFTKLHNYHVDWQLGNEPNSFRHTFNVSVNPKYLAQDFKKLRDLLIESSMNSSLVVGPDTTRPQPKRPECLKYMEEFLSNGSKYINVRSWHQYYLNSRTATVDNFWTPDTFDLLENQIQTMRNNTRDYNNIPMWLTETSSSYGGGAKGLSNSYAGSPLWLDKLGMAAKYDIKTVVRQSLVGGNYSLLDKDYKPLPDWWITVLFKKLVGNKVLDIKCQCTNKQRFYSHCTNKVYTDDETAITVFGINLEMNIVKFTLNGTALSGNKLIVEEFIFSAPANVRESKTVLFNGLPLTSDDPSVLKPQRPRYKNKVLMPPYSIGFWVMKNTSIMACK